MQDAPCPALLHPAKDGDVLPSPEELVLRKRTDAKVQGVVFFSQGNFTASEYNSTMNSLAKQDEKVLDQSLSMLLATHGYPQVLAHLVQLAQREQKPMPSAKYLMTLTPEEREPFLAAAAADALPLYEADIARPEAERVLTADLETGDFHDYETSRG